MKRQSALALGRDKNHLLLDSKTWNSGFNFNSTAPLVAPAIDRASESDAAMRAYVIGPLKRASASDVARLARIVHANKAGATHWNSTRGIQPLFIGVDDRSNSIVLNCSRDLYEDIFSLVQLIEGSSDAGTLVGRDAHALRGALNLLLWPGQSGIYDRPAFTGDPRVFGDLLWYAPGLNTTLADVQSTLEAEATTVSALAVELKKMLADLLPIVKSKSGSDDAIDPAARKLIDHARALDWQKLTIDGEGRHAAFAIYFNGAGHYSWERVLSCGLREQVVCDGTTLWHLYPEIGLGVERVVSRFHRAELAALLPWLLPPIEDLSQGTHVRLMEPNVVALVPRARKVQG